MITTASFAAILSGASLAATACRVPSRAAALERSGGLLLVLGLALLGAGFPWIVS